MSLTSNFLYCVGMVLVFPVLLPSTEAVPTPHDRDRAVLSFNFNTDLCSKLTDNSHHEEKHAANWACRKAFMALDETGGNSCSGWRQPACRSMTGYRHKVCSCKISTRIDLAIKKDLTKSFRECAIDLYTEEAFFGVVAPSGRFMRASRRLDSELEDARWVRSLFDTGALMDIETPGAGTSGTSFVGTSHAGTSYEGTSYADAPGAGVSFVETIGASTSYAGNAPGNVYPGTPLAGTSYADALGAGASYVETFRVGTSHAGNALPGNAYQGAPFAGTSNAGTSYAEGSGAGVSYGTTPQGGVNIQPETVVPIMSSPTKEGAANAKSRKRHVCKTCGNGYGTEKSYFQHIKTHITKDTTCTSCDWTFSTRSNYSTHMRKVHKREPSPSGASSSKAKLVAEKLGRGGKRFGCDVCRKEYGSAKQLRDHKISHTQILICKICRRSYTAKSIFDGHIKKAHPEYEKVGPIMSAAEIVQAYKESNPYVCNYCGTRYSSDKSHRQHMRSHLSGATTCVLCDQTYSTLSSYHYHMRTMHTEEPPPPPASGPRKGNGAS